MTLASLVLMEQQGLVRNHFIAEEHMSRNQKTRKCKIIKIKTGWLSFYCTYT